MISDLNYANTANRRRIQVTTDQGTPDLLKRAITLMLFSDDPDIRNFNDSSIVNAFSTLTEAGLSGIQFNLTVAANRIRTLLQALDDRVNNVYFDVESGDSRLGITLNVVVSDNTQTAVIYRG